MPAHTPINNRYNGDISPIAMNALEFKPDAQNVSMRLVKYNRKYMAAVGIESLLMTFDGLFNAKSTCSSYYIIKV